MANIKSPLSVVKHFSTGIASSGKCYINLFIYLLFKTTHKDPAATFVSLKGQEQSVQKPPLMQESWDGQVM